MLTCIPHVIHEMALWLQASLRRWFMAYPKSQERVCIIERMAPDARSNTMTLRLTADEVELRDALAEHHGINGSGVMRMALRELARQEGIKLSPPEKPSQKSAGRRSRD